MTPPLVFISHSAKTPEARGAQARLVKALEGAELQPLLDKREIELGDEWRRKVFNMVLECHAAVVLLSADALDSDWVVFETVGLALRKHIDPSFVMIPLLLPSVGRDAVAASRLSPLDLNELEQAGGKNLPATLTRVVKRLQPLCAAMASTPLQLLQQQVAWWLPKEPGVLLETGARLGVPAAEIKLAPDGRMRVARALLDAGFPSLRSAFEVLAPNLEKDADAERLLEVISCTWVDPAATEPIPAVLPAPSERRTVALNGSHPFTAYSYLQRASARYPSWVALETANRAGEDQRGALIADIRAAYRRLYPKRRLTNKVIDDELAADAGDDPYVVVIPGDVDESVLAPLRRKYPGVAFFVLTGNERLKPANPRIPGATVLRPPLDPAVERAAHEGYRSVSKVLAASRPR